MCDVIAWASNVIILKFILQCIFCGGSQHYGSGSQLVILGARRAPYFFLRQQPCVTSHKWTPLVNRPGFPFVTSRKWTPLVNRPGFPFVTSRKWTPLVNRPGFPFVTSCKWTPLVNRRGFSFRGPQV